jgi:putative proteasome-type protease
LTYCVAIALEQGLLFASDSRTNAGVDHVSSFCKMSIFEQAGQGAIVLLNSGNLATTQQVVSRLRKHEMIHDKALTSMDSLFSVAELVGETLRAVISHTKGETVGQSDVDFSATFLVGGQVRGEQARLFLVYPQGNFIESTVDTPFFQIGESKYGKPILDRVIRPEIAMSEAVKCMLVSFDSTIKSNLSVGLPIDAALVKQNELKIAQRFRIDIDDHYFRDLRQGWGQGLRKVFNELPVPDWLALDTADLTQPGA